MSKPFTPKGLCTFPQHQKRIEKMILEGLHDGKRWRDGSHARYAELEDGDTKRALPSPGLADPQITCDCERCAIGKHDTCYNMIWACGCNRKKIQHYDVLKAELESRKR